MRHYTHIFASLRKSCGVQYVGETGQYYCDRRKQHQSDVKNQKTTSGVSEHWRNNQEKKINWEKITFLDKKDNWKGRKIKEALYINALNPSVTMVPSRVMNMEKGFELDAIWSEFNSVLRTSIKRFRFSGKVILLLLLL